MAIDEKLTVLVDRMAAKGFEWRLQPTGAGTLVTFSKDGVKVDISSQVVKDNRLDVIERNIEYSLGKATG